jgi:hypothetical protein
MDSAGRRQRGARCCLGRPYYYYYYRETDTAGMAWHESCGLIHGMFVSALSVSVASRRVASCLLSLALFLISLCQTLYVRSFVRTSFCCIPAKRHMRHVYLPLTTLCIPVKRHMQHASRRYV